MGREAHALGYAVEADGFGEDDWCAGNAGAGVDRVLR